MRPTDDADGSGTRGDEAARLAPSLRAYGTTVAVRELATALGRLDGLSAAQRRAVASMVGHITAGVLATPRRSLDAGDEDPSVDPATVADLFGVEASTARPATDNH